MAQKTNTEAHDQKLGWIFFALFAVLIAAGIIVKRVFGHPEFMMMFHVPAAVFLVLSGRKLTRKLQIKYREMQDEASRNNP